MGADGGVCWLKVTDKERFLELVRPFGFAYFDDHYDSNYEWYLEHANDEAEGYIYATYGTSQDWSFESLRWVLDAIDGVREDAPWTHSLSIHGLHELNFFEFYLEYVTRDKDTTLGYRVLDAFAKSLQYTFDPEGEDLTAGTVYAMTLAQWADEVRKTFVEGSFGLEETWT